MQPKIQQQKKKVLLLHGWDWRKYPKFQVSNHIKHQWQNRQEFIDLMKGEFDIDYPSFPGFTRHCDFKKSWELEDYVSWLKSRIHTHKYDALVGYSFGAAVIIKYLAQSARQTPAVLISPAISRKYKPRVAGRLLQLREGLKKILGTKVTSWLRHIYMMLWVRNEFYIHGTPFLRKTYLNIVDENLSDDLRSVLRKNNNLHLVFGGEDSITPACLLFEQVPEARLVTTLVEKGSHHIGTTHPKQLFEAIRTSLNNSTHKN